jgi:hypothetical protein
MLTRKPAFVTSRKMVVLSDAEYAELKSHPRYVEVVARLEELREAANALHLERQIAGDKHRTRELFALSAEANYLSNIWMSDAIAFGELA